MVGAIRNATKKGIKAYHGSPHDFDQFSMQKIGTGEGAQAYGHGLYFAENEATAREYERALALRASKEITPATYLLSINGGNRAHAKWDALRRGYDADSDVVRAIESGTVSAPKGNMYEVAIKADPEQFLDWDAPLSQQAQGVRDAVAAVAPEADRAAGGIGAHIGRSAYAVARSAVPLKEGNLSAAVSRRLKDAGVPGIKYLDQGSRAAGEGTRNYVVFDDSLVTILKKYGVALPVIEALRRKAAANGGRVSEDDLTQAKGSM